MANIGGVSNGNNHADSTSSCIGDTGSVLDCISEARAVIVGGASGLGEATARRILWKGGKVHVMDRDAAAVERMRSEFSSNHSCLFTCADITDQSRLKDAFRETVLKFGGVNLAVNCAAVGAHCPLLDPATLEVAHSVDKFEHVMRVNATGAFAFLAVAASALAHQPLVNGSRGVIINTSSMAASEGPIGQTAYSASKGAVDAMTVPAARELAGYAVRVNVIAPSYFDTPALRQIPEPVLSHINTGHVFPSRLGQPEEFAHCVQLLFENHMINGAVLKLNAASHLPANIFPAPKS